MACLHKCLQCWCIIATAVQFGRGRRGTISRLGRARDRQVICQQGMRWESVYLRAKSVKLRMCGERARGGKEFAVLFSLRKAATPVCVWAHPGCAGSRHGSDGRLRYLTAALQPPAPLLLLSRGCILCIDEWCGARAGRRCLCLSHQGGDSLANAPRNLLHLLVLLQAAAAAGRRGSRGQSPPGRRKLACRQGEAQLTGELAATWRQPGRKSAERQDLSPWAHLLPGRSPGRTSGRRRQRPARWRSRLGRRRAA